MSSASAASSVAPAVPITHLHTTAAPGNLAAYSQAVRAGDTIYVSGCIGLDPKTSEFAAPDVAGQAKQCLDNLRTIVEHAGSSLSNVVKVVVFLVDMKDYGVFNDLYRTYFPAQCPARSCVAVSALPRGALVEVEAVVVAGAAAPTATSS